MARRGAINPKTGKRIEWEEEQARQKAENPDIRDLEARLALLKRQQKAIEARERLMPFIKFTSPDPEDPNDVEKSKYKNARHHDAIARVVEEVVEGNIPFLILTIPPRHGKSEIVSRRLPAWFIGRFPHLNGVVATYNDDFAMDFGKDVRSIISSPQYKQAFPNVRLQRGGSASDRLQTTQGGQWSFVGRGGSLTGRGAHCLVSGTSVITSDGERQIQTLRPGDKVLSYDVDRKRTVWKAVEAITDRPRARVFRITTAAGRVVEATSDHRFYVDGRWVEAAELAHGDPLVCAMPQQGPFFRCEGDTVRAVEDTGRRAVVYDIQVEETECFFANGVLVHNCLIIDDLIKDDKEAQSQAIRDQAWNWFTKVAMSRRMGKKLVIMTFTRWHADDPIGRLTDPENPNYNAKLASRIKIINLPAIAEEDDPLGREPGQALWPDGPDRFDLDFLDEQRSLDPLGFAALYQQRPSLLDGDLFKREDIRFYGPGTGVDLPENLRYYAASDHAVSTKQRRDPSCFLKVGIDPQSNIYILECAWRKMPADVAVETMLNMAKVNRPIVWWAERGHISKSIGPFLRKRMQETGIFLNVREVTPVQDKQQRAQSIAARVAMGKVYFPKSALWTEKAINEMMAFPNGTHDDFVDALAYIGLGLQSQFAPGKSDASSKSKTPAFGTLDWVKMTERWREERKAEAAFGGF